MIQFGDDELAPGIQAFTDGEAHESHKGGGIHAEGNFAWLAGVDELGHALAGMSNRFVNCKAPQIPSAALDISLDQVLHYRVKRDLGDLRARGIIEEDEGRAGGQCGEGRAECFDGKLAVGSNGLRSFPQASASRKLSVVSRRRLYRANS
jgi:hypothetical protein